MDLSHKADTVFLFCLGLLLAASIIGQRCGSECLRLCQRGKTAPTTETGHV